MTSPSLDELKNVSGIGPAAIEKFREAGYETLADVADATLDDITNVPGIGEATAQTILEYVNEEMEAVAEEVDESDAALDDTDNGDQDEAEEQPTAEGAPVDEDEEQADTGEAPATEPAPASANGAAETQPTQSQEEMIQHLSEQLSPEHLRLLRVFNDPQKWAREHEQEYPQTQFLTLSTVLEHAVPEWQNDQPQYDQLWHDLYQHGLVTPETLHVMTSRAGALSGRTSELGNAVLSQVDATHD